MMKVTDFGLMKDSWKDVETSDGTRYLKATDSRVWQLEQLCRELHSCCKGFIDEAYNFKPNANGCGLDCCINGEGCSWKKINDRMESLGLEVD